MFNLQAQSETPKIVGQELRALEHAETLVSTSSMEENNIPQATMLHANSVQETDNMSSPVTSSSTILSSMSNMKLFDVMKKMRYSFVGFSWRPVNLFGKIEENPTTQLSSVCSSCKAIVPARVRQWFNTSSSKKSDSCNDVKPDKLGAVKLQLDPRFHDLTEIKLKIQMTGVCHSAARFCVVFRPECIVEVDCSNIHFEAIVKCMRKIGMQLPSRSFASRPAIMPPQFAAVKEIVTSKVQPPDFNCDLGIEVFDHQDALVAHPEPLTVEPEVETHDITSGHQEVLTTQREDVTAELEVETHEILAADCPSDEMAIGESSLDHANVEHQVVNPCCLPSLASTGVCLSVPNATSCNTAEETLTGSEIFFGRTVKNEEQNLGAENAVPEERLLTTSEQLLAALQEIYPSPSQAATTLEDNTAVSDCNNAGIAIDVPSLDNQESIPLASNLTPSEQVEPDDIEQICSLVESMPSIDAHQRASNKYNTLKGSKIFFGRAVKSEDETLATESEVQEQLLPKLLPVETSRVETPVTDCNNNDIITTAPTLDNQKDIPPASNLTPAEQDIEQICSLFEAVSSIDTNHPGFKVAPANKYDGRTVKSEEKTPTAEKENAEKDLPELSKTFLAILREVYPTSSPDATTSVAVETKGSDCDFKEINTSALEEPPVAEKQVQEQDLPELSKKFLAILREVYPSMSTPDATTSEAEGETKSSDCDNKKINTSALKETPVAEKVDAEKVDAEKDLPELSRKFLAILREVYPTSAPDATTSEAEGETTVPDCDKEINTSALEETSVAEKEDAEQDLPELSKKFLAILREVLPMSLPDATTSEAEGETKGSDCDNKEVNTSSLEETPVAKEEDAEKDLPELSKQFLTVLREVYPSNLIPADKVKADDIEQVGSLTESMSSIDANRADSSTSLEEPNNVATGFYLTGPVETYKCASTVCQASGEDVEVTKNMKTNTEYQPTVSKQERRDSFSDEESSQKFPCDVYEALKSQTVELLERGIVLLSDTGSFKAIVNPSYVSKKERTLLGDNLSSTDKRYDTIPQELKQKIIEQAAHVAKRFENRVLEVLTEIPIFALGSNGSLSDRLHYDGSGDFVMEDISQPNIHVLPFTGIQPAASLQPFISPFQTGFRPQCVLTADIHEIPQLHQLYSTNDIEMVDAEDLYMDIDKNIRDMPMEWDYSKNEDCKICSKIGQNVFPLSTKLSISRRAIYSLLDERPLNPDLPPVLRKTQKSWFEYNTSGIGRKDKVPLWGFREMSNKERIIYSLLDERPLNPPLPSSLVKQSKVKSWFAYNTFSFREGELELVGSPCYCPRDIEIQRQTENDVEGVFKFAFPCTADSKSVVPQNQSNQSPVFSFGQMEQVHSSNPNIFACKTEQRIEPSVSTLNTSSFKPEDCKPEQAALFGEQDVPPKESLLETFSFRLEDDKLEESVSSEKCPTTTSDQAVDPCKAEGKPEKESVFEEHNQRLTFSLGQGELATFPVCPESDSCDSGNESGDDDLFDLGTDEEAIKIVVAGSLAALEKQKEKNDNNQSMAESTLAEAVVKTVLCDAKETDVNETSLTAKNLLPDNKPSSLKVNKDANDAKSAVSEQNIEAKKPEVKETLEKSSDERQATNQVSQDISQGVEHKTCNFGNLSDSRDDKHCPHCQKPLNKQTDLSISRSRSISKDMRSKIEPYPTQATSGLAAFLCRRVKEVNKELTVTLDSSPLIQDKQGTSPKLAVPVTSGKREVVSLKTLTKPTPSKPNLSISFVASDVEKRKVISLKSVTKSKEADTPPKSSQSKPPDASSTRCSIRKVSFKSLTQPKEKQASKVIFQPKLPVPWTRESIKEVAFVPSELERTRPKAITLMENSPKRVSLRSLTQSRKPNPTKSDVSSKEQNSRVVSLKSLTQEKKTVPISKPSASQRQVASVRPEGKKADLLSSSIPVVPNFSSDVGNSAVVSLKASPEGNKADPSSKPTPSTTPASSEAVKSSDPSKTGKIQAIPSVKASHKRDFDEMLEEDQTSDFEHLKKTNIVRRKSKPKSLLNKGNVATNKAESNKVDAKLVKTEIAGDTRTAKRSSETSGQLKSSLPVPVEDAKDACTAKWKPGALHPPKLEVKIVAKTVPDAPNGNSIALNNQGTSQQSNLTASSDVSGGSVKHTRQDKRQKPKLLPLSDAKMTDTVKDNAIGGSFVQSTIQPKPSSGDAVIDSKDTNNFCYREPNMTSSDMDLLKEPLCLVEVIDISGVNNANKEQAVLLPPAPQISATQRKRTSKQTEDDKQQSLFVNEDKPVEVKRKRPWRTTEKTPENQQSSNKPMKRRLIRNVLKNTQNI